MSREKIGGRVKVVKIKNESESVSSQINVSGLKFYVGGLPGFF